ncbi:unnamed protein product [Adineta ricciae]|uniref:DRBM domain-containing protein n=1 Tax=Adineta ricciae TaxID=249248 RepID=A0A816AR95_ADIRI|nr:unnamed protein product [Adineta ricciae]
MQQDSNKTSSIKAMHDLARRHKIVAEYQLEKESGPAHAKMYTVRLRLGDKEYIGVDRSIKLAQRAAAFSALNDHSYLLSINPPTQEKPTPSLHPTVALNTWAARHHIPTRYVLLKEQHLPVTKNPSWNRPQTLFYYRLHFGQDLVFDGQGPSHQQARSSCASQALHFIQNNPAPLIISIPTQIQPKSPIALMYERAKQLGLSVQLEQHDPLSITYRIGEQYLTTGTGQTKQAAKEIAAEKMLEILPSPTEKVKPKSIRKHNKQHKKFIEQKGSTEYSLTEEINPITRLYQIAQARDTPIEFIQLEELTNEKQFFFQVKFGDNECADGCGKSKQAAKRCAAENLIAKLNPELTGSLMISLPPPPIKGSLKRNENSHKQQEKKHVHFLEEQIIEHEKTLSNHHPVFTIKQQLITACQKLNIQIQYEDQLATNEDNQYESILSLSKDDRLLAKFRGHGLSVVRAHENVSMSAWKNLRQLFNGSIPVPRTNCNRYIRYMHPQLTVQQQ